MNLSFKHAAIKNKLLLLIMSVSVGSLLIAYAAFVVFQVHTVQRFLEDDQTALMNFLGEALIAPLNFNMAGDAEELLNGLAAKKGVAYAEVYDAHGQPFARYAADETQHFPFQEDRPAVQYSWRHLVLFQPIEEFPGEIEGYLLLVSNLDDQHRVMYRGLLFFLLVLVLLVALTLLIASRVQHLVSEPIIALARRMDAVTTDADYSTRFSFEADDEIGVLTRGFNRMLDQIQARDAALEHEQRTLRESEANYRGIFENAMEGIFQSGRDGAFLKANPALLGLLGYASLDDLKHQVRDVRTDLYMEPEDRDRLHRALLGEGRVQNFETRYQRADGSAVHVSLNVQAVYGEDRRLLYFEGMVTDISQRLRAEQLAVAKDAAVAADRAKSQFLANMSHEIRTPLNAVLGFTELMLKDLSMDEEKRRHYLKLVHESSASLLMIINDILDFSKVDAHKMAIEKRPFDLWALVERLAQMFQSTADRKGLNLAVEVNPNLPRYLLGDTLRLGQVLINLMGNALKFTKIGGITLRITHGADPGSHRFEVHDTGVGIPAEKTASIFNAFSQADETTSRRFGGTGLGLAISQRLVALMGGELTVTSTIGKGSCFSFELQGERDPKRRPEPQSVQGEAWLFADRHTEAQVWADHLTSRGLSVTIGPGDGLLNPPAGKPVLVLTTVDFDADPRLRKAAEDLTEADVPVFLVVSRSRSTNFNPVEHPHIHAGLIRPVTPMSLDASLRRHTGAEKGGFFITVQVDEPSGQSQGRGKKLKPDSWRDPAGDAYRILLVEDTRVNRILARAILEGAGLQVDEAENGAVALEMMGTSDYDLILMDVQMPVMDGLQTTRAIRKIQRYHDLPIIAMTAHSMSSDEARCLDAGMNGYVTKPIDTQFLFEVLSKHLKVRSVKGRSWTPELLPATLPGLNLEEAVQRIGGNELGLKQVLLNYAKQFEHAADELRRLLANGDREAAAALLHAIKGSSGNISAVKLYPLAQQAEAALKDPNRSDPDPDLLIEALDEVLAGIGTLDFEADLQPSGRWARPNLEVLMKRMAELLDHCEMEAEDLLADLTLALKDRNVDTQLTALRRQLGELDFESAAKTLEEIRNALNVGAGRPD